MLGLKCEEAHSLLSRGLAIERMKFGYFWGLFGSKKELLGWKHLRAQNFGEERFKEEGNEGGEDKTFTQICLSYLSLFVFLSFHGCILLRHVLVCL